MKEVEYVVMPSLLSPERRIYAGTMMKDKLGRGIWRTRCDVTNMVSDSFLEHYVAKTKEDSKKRGKGMKYEWYDVKGYNIKIILKKREGKKE